jgi:DEAD/DEAH box helicase domain-containing protein
VPFRSFGYVPGLNESFRPANRLENLATLCRSCHLRVEQGQRLRSGLSGLGYVLGNIAPLHLMCDPKDIGVVSEMVSLKSAETGGQTQPTLTIYEKVPAGIGFSQQLFELHEALLGAAETLVRNCPCSMGCPACVGPLFENQPQDMDAKALTLALIEACLLGGTEE